MKKGFGLKKGLGLFFVMMAVVVFLAYYGATADNNTQGLAFSLKDDGTYAVEVGQAKHLSKIVIPATYKGKPVTSIDDGAFYSCSSLTSVTIPDSVTTIGDNAFYSCSSLTSVTIPDSVTTIGSYAFSGCNSALYTEYKYGNYIGDAENPYQVLIGVTNKNLSTYQINGRTKVIAYGAFRDCSRLTNITIPNSVKGIGYAAFKSCSGLTSVTIGDGVTTIGERAFEFCSSLTSVTIGDGVTTIGDEAFYHCRSLTSVTIPDSVTTIGNRAFYNCVSLTSVTIGDSVTTIGYAAFYECDSLADVYYTGSEEEWADITIGGNNYKLTGATKHFNYVTDEN